MTVALGLGCSADGDRQAVAMFAAASLTDALRDIESGFEAAHPGVDLRLTTGGSQVLRMQIEHGARADLFASANGDHVADLVASGRLQRRAPFVRNRLVAIVPIASPIRSFAQLANAQRLVVGAPQVPVGAYTERLLTRLPAAQARALRERIVSRENNVRLVRAKVALGAADAAIVYATDARDPALRAIELPAALNPPVQYHLGWPVNPRPVVRQLLDYLRGPAGQRILAAHGFTP